MKKKFLTLYFKGHSIHTILYKNKPCWVGAEIFNIFGYSNHSKLLKDCMHNEYLECGIAFDILRKEDLKYLKNSIKDIPDSDKLIKDKTRNIIILYDIGLLAFANFSRKPLANSFKNWLNTTLFPELIAANFSVTHKPLNEFKVISNQKKVSHNLNFINQNFLELNSSIKYQEQEQKIRTLEAINKNIELLTIHCKFNESIFNELILGLYALLPKYN
ncbi:MAG: BRO family protein [Sarcina sp.]